MSPKPVPPLQLKVPGGSQQIVLLPLLGAHPIVLGPKLSKLSHVHKFSILLPANTQNVAGIFALLFLPRQLPQLVLQADETVVPKSPLMQSLVSGQHLAALPFPPAAFQI
jgi:hypothetical protein